ncbi:hypothetical protein FKM82_031293 [Ascaphus truei]
MGCTCSATRTPSLLTRWWRTPSAPTGCSEDPRESRALHNYTLQRGHRAQGRTTAGNERNAGTVRITENQRRGEHDKRVNLLHTFE